jgi:hypothetical protein
VLDRVHFAPSALCQAVEVSYSKQTIYIRVDRKIFVLSFSRKFKKTFLVQTYFRLSMDVKRAIKLKGSKLRSCKKFIVKQPHKRKDQDPHFILCCWIRALEENYLDLRWESQRIKIHKLAY